MSVSQSEALKLIRTGYDLAKLHTVSWEEIESNFRESVATMASPVHHTGKESGAGVGNPASSPIHANSEIRKDNRVASGSRIGRSGSS